MARFLPSLALRGARLSVGLCSWNRGRGDLCAAFRPAGTSSSQSRCRRSCSCEFRPRTHHQVGEVNHPKMEDANSVSPIPGTDAWSFWSSRKHQDQLVRLLLGPFVLYPHGEMSRLLLHTSSDGGLTAVLCDPVCRETILFARNHFQICLL